jgi:hypothetical protein
VQFYHVQRGAAVAVLAVDLGGEVRLVDACQEVVDEFPVPVCNGAHEQGAPVLRVAGARAEENAVRQPSCAVHYECLGRMVALAPDAVEGVRARNHVEQDFGCVGGLLVLFKGHLRLHRVVRLLARCRFRGGFIGLLLPLRRLRRCHGSIAGCSCVCGDQQVLPLQRERNLLVGRGDHVRCRAIGDSGEPCGQWRLPEWRSLAHRRRHVLLSAGGGRRCSRPHQTGCTNLGVSLPNMSAQCPSSSACSARQRPTHQVSVNREDRAHTGGVCTSAGCFAGILKRQCQQAALAGATDQPTSHSATS